MKRNRKLHRADAANAANAETLRRAVRFDVAWSPEPGSTPGASAAALDEARIEAMRLKAENETTRRPLIYGVTADGCGALIN